MTSGWKRGKREGSARRRKNGEKSGGRMTDGQSREWRWDGMRAPEGAKKAGAAGDHGDAPTKTCRAKAAGSAEPHRHRGGGWTSRGRRVTPEPPRRGCRWVPAERPPPPGTVPAALRRSPLLEELPGSAAQRQSRGRRTAARGRGSPIAAAAVAAGPGRTHALARAAAARRDGGTSGSGSAPRPAPPRTAA